MWLIRVLWTDSHQPVLRGEERLHVGGSGGGDAAADGAEPAAHAADAHRHPVPHYVPAPGRLRHEHPVPPHRQAGEPPPPPGQPAPSGQRLTSTRPAGVEVPQGVGGLREVLPADQAAVLQRSAAAAAAAAGQRV